MTLLSIITCLSDEESKEYTGQLMSWLKCPQLELVVQAINGLQRLAALRRSDSSELTMLIIMANSVVNRITSHAYSMRRGLGENNTAYSTITLLARGCNFFIMIHTDIPQFLDALEKLSINSKMVAAHQELMMRFETQKNLLSKMERKRVEETITKMGAFLMEKGIVN